MAADIAKLGADCLASWRGIHLGIEFAVEILNGEHFSTSG